MYGDMESHAERYARTREFIAIMRDLWRGEPVDHESDALSVPRRDRLARFRHSRCRSTSAATATTRSASPRSWPTSISSGATRSPASKGGWRRCARTRRRSYALADTPLRYGLRCHVIVRETEDEAWKAAERLISRIDPEVRRRFIEASARVDSEGQRRQLALAASSSLVVEPHLWAGVGLARSGVGVAIVGDPAQVAAKLRAYQSARYQAHSYCPAIRISRNAGDSARW